GRGAGLRYEAAQQPDGTAVSRRLTSGPVGLERVEGSIDDHASPVEHVLDFIDLEGDPGSMTQREELGPRRGSTIEPAAIVHVMHRLDIDLVVMGIGETTDLVPRQDLLAGAAVEYGEVGLGAADVTGAWPAVSCSR